MTEDTPTTIVNIENYPERGISIQIKVNDEFIVFLPEHDIRTLGPETPDNELAAITANVIAEQLAIQIMEKHYASLAKDQGSRVVASSNLRYDA